MFFKLWLAYITNQSQILLKKMNNFCTVSKCIAAKKKRYFASRKKSHMTKIWITTYLKLGDCEYNYAAVINFKNFTPGWIKVQIMNAHQKKCHDLLGNNKNIQPEILRR